MICEVYRRRGLLGKRRTWTFRLRFSNGRVPNHSYRDATDALRGARDLIDAIRAEGDGVEFRILDNPDHPERT